MGLIQIVSIEVDGAVMASSQAYHAAGGNDQDKNTSRVSGEVPFPSLKTLVVFLDIFLVDAGSLRVYR